MSPLAPAFSDMDALLGQEKQAQRQQLPAASATYRRVGGCVGAALALGAMVAVATRQRSEALGSNVSAVVGLSAVPDGCFKKGMFYYPHIMAGTVKTIEASPEDCQARCVAQDGCAHFTLWPDGGCLLTANTSALRATPVTFSNTTIGPKSCEDLSTFEVFMPSGVAFCDKDALYEGPSAGPAACELSCGGTPDCNFYSIWSTGGKHWCRLTSTCDTVGQQSGQTITVYKSKPHVTASVTAVGPATASVTAVGPATTSTAGVNGTSCSAYPACVAAGMEGTCCPNSESVALGCCNGFPTPVIVASVTAGAECSAFSACVALNLTEGGCCPTFTGVRLGCCDA